MVPDIERQWIAEERKAEPPNPRWFLALLIAVVLIYWKACG